MLVGASTNQISHHRLILKHLLHPARLHDKSSLADGGCYPGETSCYMHTQACLIHKVGRKGNGQAAIHFAKLCTTQNICTWWQRQGQQSWCRGRWCRNEQRQVLVLTQQLLHSLL